MRGAFYTWMVILVSMFIIAIVYAIMSPILNDYFFPMCSEVNNTNITSVCDTIQTSWNYFPLIVIFGLMLYGFVRAQKREPDEYAYG